MTQFVDYGLSGKGARVTGAGGERGRAHPFEISSSTSEPEAEAPVVSKGCVDRGVVVVDVDLESEREVQLNNAPLRFGFETMGGGGACLERVF